MNCTGECLSQTPIDGASEAAAHFCGPLSTPTKSDAWLINVARGRLVKTDDLVRALQEHWIGGAGLDVTDPEPLPDGHPLWQLDNCIITSHTANPPNLDRELFRRRIIENVRRFVAGDRLLGVVDRAAGY